MNKAECLIADICNLEPSRSLEKNGVSLWPFLILLGIFLSALPFNFPVVFYKFQNSSVIKAFASYCLTWVNSRLDPISIDRDTHILRFLLVALCFTQISQIPTGTYNTPLSANPLLERVTYFSMAVPVGFLPDDINLRTEERPIDSSLAPIWLYEIYCLRTRQGRQHRHRLWLYSTWVYKR